MAKYWGLNEMGIQLAKELEKAKVQELIPGTAVEMLNMTPEAAVKTVPALVQNDLFLAESIGHLANDTQKAILNVAKSTTWNSFMVGAAIGVSVVTAYHLFKIKKKVDIMEKKMKEAGIL